MLEEPMTSLRLKGNELTPYLHDLGKLRIEVFAQWPYLYQGDLEYEKKYLNTYVKSQNSFAYLLFKNKVLVGATTAILLTDETEEIQKPFLQKGIDPQSVVYLGESILLPEFRGQGFGKTFMKERLDFARSFEQVETAAFCAVVRDPNDPRRPESYQPLDPFWKSLSFSPVPQFMAQMSWRDIGESKESQKSLQFWMKSLR